jgi:nitrogen fixation protein NifU and related proteins
MDLDQMEFVLDHYKNPRNAGTLCNADYSHEEGNPTCGDKIRMDLKVDDNIITDVKFLGKGCAISQASASILTEQIIGKNIKEVKDIGNKYFLEMLGVDISPIRYKCALLSLKVLKTVLFGEKSFEYEH